MAENGKQKTGELHVGEAFHYMRLLFRGGKPFPADDVWQGELGERYIGLVFFHLDEGNVVDEIHLGYGRLRVTRHKRS